jgi:CRP/FNR family transcriptional regulator
MELRCWPESQPRSGAVPVEREPTLAAGSSLWRHGATFDGLYLVRSGGVKVFEVDASGEERVLQFAFAGDMLGLDALADAHHENSAVALVETMVCRMAWPPLEATAHAAAQNGAPNGFHIGAGNGAHHVTGSPALLHRLLQRASTLLRQRTRATHLADPDASVRSFLHEMAERIGREERFGDQKCLRLRLPMSRLEIGQYLGYAEETVCRSMRRLQRQGEIEVSGRTLLLKPAVRAVSVPAIQRPAPASIAAR